MGNSEWAALLAMCTAVRAEEQAVSIDMLGPRRLRQ